MIRRTMLAALLTLACAGAAGAQVAGGARQRALDTNAAGQGEGRGRLEQQVRRRMFQVVQNRVGLDESQMRKLAAVTQQLERDRRDLMIEERNTRLALRDQVTAPQPDQTKIDAGMKAMLRIQRRRIDLVEKEQQQLAAFMTPLQRAKYMALQEQMRRRLEQMRQQRQRAGALAPDTPF